MSMLADRRKKVKWSLNPRGKEWSEDTNKFGQRMLEKMGWKKGKGLGRNEDGNTENVKVYHKTDAAGLGFKESENPWTKNEIGFSELLQNLSSQAAASSNDIAQNGVNTPLPIESLEEKSKKSRTRVHYKKITKGKDLSQYSRTDLAQIFGKPTFESTPDSSINPSTSLKAESMMKIKIGQKNEGGIINPALNISDEIQSSAKSAQEWFDENCIRVVYPSLCTKMYPPLEDDLMEDEQVPNIKRCKKLKKDVDNAGDIVDTSKKRKKLTKVGIVNEGLNISDDNHNGASFASLHIHPKKHSHMEFELTENTEIPNKRRKKLEEDIVQHTYIVSELTQNIDKPKKKHCKKFQEYKIKYPHIEPELTQNIKIPKKNHCKKIQQSLFTNSHMESKLTQNCKYIERSKKKRHKKLREGIVNPALDVSTDNVDINSNSPKKRKKKEKGIDNLALDISEDEIKLKKKKRSKKVSKIKSALKPPHYLYSAVPRPDKKSVRFNLSLNREISYAIESEPSSSE